MKILRSFKFPVVLFLTLVVTGVTFITNASAFTGNSFFDGFSQLPLKPDPAANWYIINWGDDGMGGQTRVLDYCASATCVQLGSETGVDYVELAQYPGQSAGLYYATEISEYETGYAYGLPTQWTPELGHPVVFEARAKWSPDYQLNGGTATGSTGIWLWNSPGDWANDTFHPADAIGLQWSSATSAIPGLSVSAFDNDTPMFLNSVRNIDMSAWNTFRVEWSVNQAGIQFVEITVNGHLLAHRPLLNPLSNLSVTVWNDNQSLQADGSVLFEAPTEDQSIYIDYVSLSKN